MSIDSHNIIYLIDLSKQFPFEIDEKIKQQITFSESLIVSCGHYDGDVERESSQSEWSCNTSTKSNKSEEIVKFAKDFNVQQDIVQENVNDKETEEEDDNFQFYFFPDCIKPVSSQGSNDSVIIVDGVPRLNPAKKEELACTCNLDKEGTCPCHIKLPCQCGAKTVDECVCHQADNICICNEGSPQPICTCKPSDVCVCYSESKLRPVCTCAEVDKPCVCHPHKFPCPVCPCQNKPKSTLKSISSQREFEEEGIVDENKSETGNELQTKKQPCVCQNITKKHCLCIKGKECICNENMCICGVRKTCVCESTDTHKANCENQDSKSICSCPMEQVCTCGALSSDDCKCYEKLKQESSTSGDRLNCNCYSSCQCVDPCLSVIKSKRDEFCPCITDETIAVKLTNEISSGPKSNGGGKKLKKVRAGKHGYRWCHDVDPRHTYFDYAYNRHDKISYKEQEKEKFKILGLYTAPTDEEKLCTVQSVNEIKAPHYHKIRKPSLDCCSAVGGLCISVETLGEEKDKFLVQMVSHTSKEGAKAGSKLVSIVDCNLHTLEENRSEHITKKDVTKEHRSYMSICESGYYNKVTRICGDRHFMKRLYHSFEDCLNFLLEGANIVLLRYFAIRRYKGNVKTDTVLINGTICESIYVCLGVSQAIVNGKSLFVVKVERHIVEPTGFIHQTLTVLTLRGYTISHEWADNNYIFHLNPLLQVYPETDEIEEHEPLRENWRRDLQLMSDFLDFKSSRSSEGARYVRETGELTGVISDYLQALLLLRPQDALHFTRHYFGAALSALDLPHDEYFDPCSKHHLIYELDLIFYLASVLNSIRTQEGIFGLTRVRQINEYIWEIPAPR